VTWPLCRTDTCSTPGSCVEGGRDRCRGGEADVVAAGERSDQCGRGVEGDERPVVDDRHPVGQRLGLLHVVGRQHDGAPLGVDRRISSHRLRRLCGSSPVVGSSRNTTSGSLTSAATMLNRCACPPESWPTGRGACRSARRLEQLVGVAPGGVEGAEQAQDLPQGEQLEVRRGLELDADAVLEGSRWSRTVSSPSTLARPGGRPAEALEDLQRRGLAGAVRAEQREDLAAADLEAEAGDGVEAATVGGRVGADQVVDLDREGRWWVRIAVLLVGDAGCVASSGTTVPVEQLARR
jgi:hypothetical protein